MRAHSGWAVAVAVARLGQAPRVVLRKRIELIAEDTPKQPYHAAQSLASHAAIHTAEGELFRNALIEAAKHWRLPVVPVKERELFDRSAEKLGRPVDEIRERIKEMGAQLGPPWRMDEKLSALLAWLVLAERPNT